MNTKIQNELRRIERERRVRVLYAAESGSRAWGFASRDSDYDVRFIYAHEDGVAEGQGQEVIEEHVDNQIDICGWNLARTMALLKASNPSLLGWMKSPVVYEAEPGFALTLGSLAAESFSRERAFQHYLQAAKANAAGYLQGDMVLLKKYLYVLRMLLACRWIERRNGAVPMKFDTLVDELIDEPLLRIHIGVLVARKRAGEEAAKAQRVPVVSRFIEKEIVRFERGERPQVVAQEDSDGELAAA